VTYLGIVEEWKNVKSLLQVAKRVVARHDVHFVIAGKLEGGYGRGVWAESLGLGNVSVIGAIPDMDLPSLVRDTYLSINMIRSEALGLSQLEFMYQGVPVVSSGAGGQSWIVEDGRNGVILAGPEDVEGAASAITKLADDQERRNKLGLKAKSTASEATMPELIRMLSDEISRKLVPGGETRLFEPGELVVEAWARKGEKVAVTTKRLIIGTAKGGRAVIVPLSEIIRVTRRHRISLKIPVSGALGTLLLLAAGIWRVPLVSRAESLLLSAAQAHFPSTASFLPYVLPFIPILMASSLGLLSARSGYLVHYARGAAFLPSEFVKAVKVIESLAPQGGPTEAGKT